MLTKILERRVVNISTENECGVIVFIDTENFANTSYAKGLPFDVTLALETAAKFGNVFSCNSLGAIDSLPEVFDRQRPKD